MASVPEYFVFDEDELALVDPARTKPDDETLLRVARACPSGAIQLLHVGEEIDI